MLELLSHGCEISGKSLDKNRTIDSNNKKYVNKRMS